MVSTTPGAVRTTVRSMLRTRACGISLMPTARCNKSRGAGRSSVYAAAPETCRCALSCGSALPTVLAPIGIHRLRGFAACFQPEATQQILHGEKPHIRRRTHVRDWAEVPGQRIAGAADRICVPRRATNRRFAGRGTFDYFGEATAGHAEAGYGVAIELQPVRSTNGRDILVESLRPFLAADDYAIIRQWNSNGRNKLAGLKIVNLVSVIKLIERP